MNRLTLRRAARMFGRITADDITAAVGAMLIFATLAAGIWVLAGLGLVESGHELAGVAR